MSETIKHSTYELLKGLEEVKEGIKSRDSALLKALVERDKLRGSLDNAACLKEHSDLLREVAKVVADEAGLGVLDLKSAPFMVRQLIERNQNQLKMVKDAHERERRALEDRDQLKVELEEERDKNAGYVYITAPEGIARAQGRKLERERIIGLVRERTNGHHAGSKLDCLACTEDFAIISLLEKGE